MATDAAAAAAAAKGDMMSGGFRGGFSLVKMSGFDGGEGKPSPLSGTPIS